MSCPWCGWEGRLIKAIKPRPSTQRTWMCPDCYGEVTKPAPIREEVFEDVE